VGYRFSNFLKNRFFLHNGPTHPHTEMIADARGRRADIGTRVRYIIWKLSWSPKEGRSTTIDPTDGAQPLEDGRPFVARPFFGGCAVKD